MQELHACLQEAGRLLRYRFFFGPSSVLTNADIDASTRLLASIPEDVGRLLLDAIHFARREDVRNILQEFASIVRQQTYQGALALYHKLCVELISDYEQLTLPEDNDALDLRSFVEDLPDMEFASDVDRKIARACASMMDAVERAAQSKTVELVHDAVSHIHAHCEDPNLCLDVLADDLRVSGGHLGKVFIAIHRRSVADYINEVRIERAKTLLRETEMTVGKIAESVGIVNDTYFYTLFRKLVGPTPARYRRHAPRQRT